MFLLFLTNKRADLSKFIPVKGDAKMHVYALNMYSYASTTYYAHETINTLYNSYLYNVRIPQQDDSE